MRKLLSAKESFDVITEASWRGSAFIQVILMRPAALAAADKLARCLIIAGLSPASEQSIRDKNEVEGLTK